METSKIIELLVVGMLGALAAVIANKGIAVFNDGLRPIIPQFLDNKIGRKELAATSFALGFGLVIGFGIPVSVGASIILVHSILLATDIIGTWSPGGMKGVIISAIIGGIYGIAIVLGLQYIVDLFAMLPVNFLDALAKVGAPVIVAFSVFPSLAVAYQHGFKKGAITFGTSIFFMFLVKEFGVIQISDTATLKLSVEGTTLLVGMAFMIFFSLGEKGSGSANQQLVSIFAERVKRIKSNWIILAVMGGLVSAATSLLILAGDPISQKLMIEGLYSEAALAAFARGIGFIPLVFSTAIVTGVYGPAGTTFVFVIGILFRGNPLLAFVAGFAVIVVEILLLDSAAKGLDKFPGVREMGEHIRTAMNKVLEVGLLIGGALASEAIAPGIGYFWVIGIYLLNKTAKKPLVDLAVGPVAAISLGLLVNILALVGLFTIPTV
ncbi:inner membrane protein [Erysipelotrichaceae bacterium]|nr:inner membrane protein [Erysipelotrichaceae bacterium]